MTGSFPSCQHILAPKTMENQMNLRAHNDVENLNERDSIDLKKTNEVDDYQPVEL